MRRSKSVAFQMDFMYLVYPIHEAKTNETLLRAPLGVPASTRLNRGRGAGGEDGGVRGAGIEFSREELDRE